MLSMFICFKPGESRQTATAGCTSIGATTASSATGMRRSELLGVRRDSLNLDAGTLTIDETLISVDGRAEESDGKTAAGVQTVSLDAFTIAALRRHLAMLDA